MDVRGIHRSLVNGKAVIPLIVLFCVAMRFVHRASWMQWEVWATLSIQIAIALLWLRFNHQFTIIRKRTIFPAFFFLLFCGANPLFFSSVTASAVGLGIMFCLFFLFSSYQGEYTQDSGFNIALITGICSIPWPPMLFLLPVFWLGAYWLQAFHWKYFFASILGLFTVFLFISAWSAYHGDWDILTSQLGSFQQLGIFELPDFSLVEWIVTGLTVLLVVTSGIHLLLSSNQEKIRTRRYFLFLFTFAVVVFIIMMLQSSEKESWVQIACIPCSVIVAHYFALVEKKMTLYLFFISTLVFAVLYCLK